MKIKTLNIFFHKKSKNFEMKAKNTLMLKRIY
jgi:hypothetical protein